MTVDICPILIMMAVTTLVVHPGFAVALILTLSGVGATGALEVFCACPELCRGLFGQVVGQTLPIKANTETADRYQPAVFCDGHKMFPRFHENNNSLSFNETDSHVAAGGSSE